MSGGQYMRILLIKDAERCNALLAAVLRQAGYGVDMITTSDDLSSFVQTVRYNLLVVDVQLLDFIEVVRSLRSEHRSVRILVIAGNNDVDDRIRGLDAGADDYMVIPVNHAEMLARARALLRRPGKLTAPIFRAGNLELTKINGEVRCGKRIVNLPLGERRLLELLLRRVGCVVPKESLEKVLSGTGRRISGNAVEVQVSRLRKTLGSIGAGSLIETVHGVGYVLKPAPAIPRIHREAFDESGTTGKLSGTIRSRRQESETAA
jgi:DNA-binding response OmpR family regulator